MNALNLLLERTIDYAGLFPPAGLSIAETVFRFDQYRNSSYRSRLGRLVVNWKQLDSIEEAVRRLNPADDGNCWKISALLPCVSTDGKDVIELQAALQSVADFNLRFAPSVPSDTSQADPHFVGLMVDSLEVKISHEGQIEPTTSEIRAAMDHPNDFPVDLFLEIDCHADPTALIKQTSLRRQETSDSHLYAKIRTGSVVAQEIPESREVARFIECCTTHQLPFKATAGLHHPLRGEYRMTYQPDSTRGMMHGYVNMFVATLMSVEHQLNQSQIEAILNETDSTHFQFDYNSVAWQSFRITRQRIEELRQQTLLSFGSCSFDEPTQELAAIYPTAELSV